MIGVAGLLACDGEPSTSSTSTAGTCNDPYDPNYDFDSASAMPVEDPDGALMCQVSPHAADWCRANLPCWSTEPDCPPFEEFVQVIGWVSSDPGYIFTAYDTYTDVLECEGGVAGPVLLFRIDNVIEYPYRVYFAGDSRDVLGVEFFDFSAADDAFPCGPGTAARFWWGPPVGDVGECEGHYRQEYDYLADDDGPAASPTEDEDHRGGCAHVTPPWTVLWMALSIWPRVHRPRDVIGAPAECAG